MVKTEIIYLDTNIVLDILDKQRKNHQTAFLLLEKLIYQNYTIAISEDMLSTIYYISKDKKRALEFFEFIIANNWKIVNFGINVILEAIKISKDSNSDFEDILQCLTAKNIDAKYLITNDKKFINCGISILTPDEFLK
jgi:predicted nucleic acid-binding protein